MMAETGCDGVVVGRGCLGRPWLFGDLAAAFAGSDERFRPSLGQVAEAFRRHAELLVDFFESEERGCRDIRKHVAWYFKGYAVGGDLRARLATVESLAQLDELLGTLDWSQPYPGEAAEGQRGVQDPRRPRPCPTAGSTPASSTPCSATRSRQPRSTTAVDDRALWGYSLVDTERFLPEDHSTRRSDFARDRARLFHSSAYAAWRRRHRCSARPQASTSRATA